MSSSQHPIPSGLPARVDHPLRRRLTAELHARPAEEIEGSIRAVHFTLVCEADKDRERVTRLCAAQSAAAPAPDGFHLSADLGRFRLKWERHTEFSTYTFFYPGEDSAPFATPPASLVPNHWLDGLDDQVLVAKYVALVQGRKRTPDPEVLAPLFGTREIVGSIVGGGRGMVWSDLDIHNDGFSRVLVHDLDFGPRQRGRMLQRIMEIETYRLMAMLAHPLARELGPQIAKIDEELAALANRGASQTEQYDAKTLLAELQNLSSDIEDIAGATNYRFSAAQAYYELVLERVAQLREERTSGLSTIGDVVDRRLAPSIRTCESVQERIENLSARTSRLSNLLRTRVDIALETQNRDLLRSMDRRARLQLRLQETVEGLSVLVLSYYAVGLLNYLLKGLKSIGWPINVELLSGASIPVLVLSVWLGVRLMRARLTRKPQPDETREP